QRVDDAEDGGVGADTQRERGHRNGSEGGTTDKKSYAVGEVAAEHRQQLCLACRLRRRQGARRSEGPRAAGSVRAFRESRALCARKRRSYTSAITSARLSTSLRPSARAVR